MKAPKFQIIPSKITDPQVAECLRGLKAAQCFRHLLDAAKEQIDYAKVMRTVWVRRRPFYRLGSAAPSIRSSGYGNSARPPRSAQDRQRPNLEARRMVLLMCVALERVGFSKVQRKLHKFAAGALRGTTLFARSPTYRTIEHWAEEPLQLGPLDEQLLAACIAVCGHEAPDKIALVFHQPCASGARPGGDGADRSARFTPTLMGRGRHTEGGMKQSRPGIGCRAAKVNGGADPAELVSDADTGTHGAKGSRRSRCVMYSPKTPPPQGHVKVAV